MLILIGVGPQNAALQVIVPNEMRGQVTALFLFLFTMIGFGIAPTVVALLTDYVFRDEMKLRYSIATMHAVLAPLAAFVFWRGLGGIRPGGRARAHLAELTRESSTMSTLTTAPDSGRPPLSAGSLRAVPRWKATCATARSRAGSRPTCAAASTASVRISSIRRACRTSRSTAKVISACFASSDGHVDYRSRYVRTQRYKAQADGARGAVRHLSQPVHGRSARRGPEPRHGEHRRRVPSRQAAGAEGGQPAGRRRCRHRSRRSTITTRSTASSESLTFTAHPEDRLRDAASSSRSVTKRAARRPTTSRS